MAQQAQARARKPDKSLVGEEESQLLQMIPQARCGMLTHNKNVKTNKTRKGCPGIQGWFGTRWRGNT